MGFVLYAFILLVVLQGYFRVADRYNIIDKPNHRSSHTRVTIRGGGIVFAAAALLWFLLNGFSHPWHIGAMLLMASVSFLDDLMTLSRRIRIVVHFTAVSLLFWQSGVWGLPWYAVILAYILTIGWINAFNFMDGINGITAFYALASLITLSWLNHNLVFVPQSLFIVLIISVIIFAFFNARTQAKTFAGDVGSVTMAFLLAWFMIALIMKTGRAEFILFFAVYGIDAAFTIFFRLKRRENIFDAHRTHLYQYLSNELKWPHVQVAALYALVQLLVNGLTVLLFYFGLLNAMTLAFFLMALSGIYLCLRNGVIRKIYPPIPVKDN